MVVEEKELPRYELDENGNRTGRVIMRLYSRLAPELEEKE
jgi:hypothetical protein